MDGATTARVIITLAFVIAEVIIALGLLGLAAYVIRTLGGTIRTAAILTALAGMLTVLQPVVHSLERAVVTELPHSQVVDRRPDGRIPPQRTP